jgi:hypothetical protein
MKLELVLPCVVALVLGSVATHASIPASANGAITACMDPNGALKVIDVDAGERCAIGRQTLTFTSGDPRVRTLTGVTPAAPRLLRVDALSADGA